MGSILKEGTARVVPFSSFDLLFISQSRFLIAG
jgi:hypothetical protein